MFTPRQNKKQTNKNKKEGKQTSKKKRILKNVFIVIATLIVVFAGILAGVIFSLFGGKYAITKQELIINYSNSTITDQDGNVLAVLSAKENRKILNKSEMGDYLPKAFVSIEDERFYRHHGVDIKRTSAAIASYIFHFGSSSYGGSTITQQLVKNLTGDSTDSIARKIKEWWKAWQLETCLSKDEILEQNTEANGAEEATDFIKFCTG